VREVSLELREISKSYGGTKVLESVSFELARGELMVLLGPSGSGKSKTLEIVAGIEEPDSGRVFIEGEDVTERSPRERGIGFVFQDYSLFPHKTVFENIAFGLRMRGAEGVKEEVERIAREVKVEELLDRYPRQLSGGEQQRVALARALVVQPRLLLFDEPLSSLDQRVRERLRRSLKSLQRMRDITTLYVTHDYIEAIALADRITVLKEGRVLQTGTADEIFYRPKNREVAEFTGMTNIFSGRVLESTQEGSRISFDGLAIQVDRSLQPGRATICIRPESIMFIRPDRPSTFENTFEGRVAEVESFGSGMKRIAVEVGGTTFYVNVPNHVVEKMSLKPGRDVKISLKKEKVHVMQREG